MNANAGLCKSEPSPRILPTWLDTLSTKERMVIFSVEDSRLVQMVTKLHAQQLVQGEGCVRFSNNSANGIVRKKQKNRSENSERSMQFVPLSAIEEKPDNINRHIAASNTLLAALFVGTSARAHDTIVVRGDLIDDVTKLLSCLNDLYFPGCFLPSANPTTTAAPNEWQTIGLVVAQHLKISLWQRWRTAVHCDVNGSSKVHPIAAVWNQMDTIRQFCLNVKLQEDSPLWQSALRNIRYNGQERLVAGNNMQRQQAADEMVNCFIRFNAECGDTGDNNDYRIELTDACRALLGSSISCMSSNLHDPILSLATSLLSRLLNHLTLDEFINRLTFVPLRATVTPFAPIFGEYYQCSLVSVAPLSVPVCSCCVP